MLTPTIVLVLLLCEVPVTWPWLLLATLPSGVCALIYKLNLANRLEKLED